jgi:hypothetical protein
MVRIVALFANRTPPPQLGGDPLVKIAMLPALLAEAAHHLTRVGSGLVWLFLICTRFSTSANLR